MSYDTAGAPNGGTATYRAFCPTCKKAGREFSQYGNAEAVATGHANQHKHTTWVIDHYGMRVAGSTQTPHSSHEGESAR